MGSTVPNDALNEFLEQATAGRASTIELATKLMTGTNGPRETLVVTMKRPVETPIRMESPARAHVFNVPQGFAEYLQRYGSAHVVVLADPETGRMAAVLDEEADSGLEIIWFEPKLHPLYKPWHQLIGTSTPIKEFAQFIQAHKDQVVGDRQIMCQVFQQIRLSKAITVQQGTGAKSINGVVCEMSLAGTVKNVPADLPELIVIQCPMFVETPELEIGLDLAVEVTSHDEIRVRVTSSDAEVQRIKCISDMLAKVQAALPEATVSLGTLSYKDWPYVEGM